MKEILKNNKMSIIIAIIYVFVLIFKSDMAVSALNNSTYYLIEMAQILPVIFMLTVSIDVLIPKEWIIKRLGGESGLSGAFLALAFGSLSAGPIYAAFPIAKMLHKKGASVNNVVIILSAWAVIKVPMLANEAKFLGPQFMAVRWGFTVIFIFAIAWIMGKTKVEIKGDDLLEKDTVKVVAAYCIGCKACEKAMPEVFLMNESKAIVLENASNIKKLPNEKKELLNKIARKCPTHAIVVSH